MEWADRGSAGASKGVGASPCLQYYCWNAMGVDLLMWQLGGDACLMLLYSDGCPVGGDTCIESTDSRTVERILWVV